MSEVMRPIKFNSLMEWILSEYGKNKTIFGIRENKFYKNKTDSNIVMFNEKLSSPFGPAAGPNSQLTQNIIAAYLCGCRFMELKTVQIIDGEDLSKCVARPCINATDECYNVEWSTELTVGQAFDEYVKAWFALHVLGKELGISNERDFAFNMSVGYDFEGITSPKVDGFIEGLKDASKSEIWKECVEYLNANLDKFSNFKKEDLDKISSCVASSITLSTLHGCPPQEIERIATYFLKEKNVHTYIKCNPTLLGYEFARKKLNELGFDYISFDEHHFNNDLQYADGIAMFKRLMALAKEKDLDFGLKITNTFPVQIKNDELPGEEMYMSGRSLFPLSLSLAAMLSKEFNGTLPISYSGGADHFNVEELIDCGIQPITVATTILKPGGYSRIQQMAQQVEPLLKGKFNGIDVAKITAISDGMSKRKYNLKATRPVGSRKTSEELPLVDCAKAPCKQGGCPINQQIPEYLSLVSEEKYDEAFEIIANDNTAPAITGTICDHQCQNKCTRLDYDAPLEIRNAKSLAATNAQQAFTKNIKVAPLNTDKKAVIIGAGPAGIATSMFLRRNGMSATVLERREKPYGAVTYTIPEFRIPAERIKNDYDMAVATGVEFKFGCNENFDVQELKKQYDYVVLAIGSWEKCAVPVKEGGENLTDALAFLEESKKSDCKLSLGKTVAVIGGGDVAMDCARTAKKTAGVEKVSIVYRRTKAFMPASPEELELAVNDGIAFDELLGPVSYKDGILTCEVMELSEKDASGRRSVKSTGITKELQFDTVVNATGARVQTEFFKNNNVELTERNLPKLGINNATSIEGVYVAGDCKAGPATIVKAIADGKMVAADILMKSKLALDFKQYDVKQDQDLVYDRKGILKWATKEPQDGKRCLVCDQVCELCVDVCPNRANVLIDMPDSGLDQAHQILHMDGMCNECGNCGVFCPYTGNPYKDKITAFWTEHDFTDSTNKGFLRVGENKFKVRNADGTVVDHELGQDNISSEIQKMMDVVLKKYPHYLV